jgi:hypothetical protein
MKFIHKSSQLLALLSVLSLTGCGAGCGGDTANTAAGTNGAAAGDEGADAHNGNIEQADASSDDEFHFDLGQNPFGSGESGSQLGDGGFEFSFEEEND